MAGSAFAQLVFTDYHVVKSGCLRLIEEAMMDSAVETVQVSARMTALRAEVMRKGGSFPTGANPFVRDVALERAQRPGRSRVQIRAALLKELVSLAPIELPHGWRLAGVHLLPLRQLTSFGSARSDIRADQLADLGIAAQQAEPIRKVVSEWVAGRSQNGYAYGELDPAAELGRCGWADGSSLGVFMAGGWSENHSIRDYAKVLRLGYAGIRREIQGRMARADLADPDYVRQSNFWRAALDVCDAGILLGQRYAAYAQQLAREETDPDECLRLREIAAVCARVPAEGARSLLEAIQALWLAHILTCGEDGINANSLGRLDQFLYPYYAADLEAGRLTRAQAVELMEELACKLYLEYDVQAITLAGQDAAGLDATNELSFLILEATRNLGFVRDLSIRLHKQSPRPFVRAAAAMIAGGGGIPYVFNDECFVPALAERGIALEDARNYAPIGCIELTIPGRANPHAVSGWFNALKCLELALFDGCDPRSGTQLGPHTGLMSEMRTYDALWQAYQVQVETFARRLVYGCNRGELAQREYGPLPCLSTLTDDCIARGRDITDGGAVYNYHSICFLGTANVADSLMAIRELVFAQGRVSAERLLAALHANWTGDESLRQMFLHLPPKYGNDQAPVDAIARQVTDHFISLMDGMHSPLGAHYVVHLFSFLINLPFGRAVGATPDGRLAEEPLAYSLSAHQGRDERGVTALLNSLACLPHERAAGATAAIIEMEPRLVEGEAGIERLTDTILGAIRMGVGQMQFNVTTVERLLQAQQDPEHYGNIAVRVAGYSQMFKLIAKDLQDHIIARTKHVF